MHKLIRVICGISGKKIDAIRGEKSKYGSHRRKKYRLWNLWQFNI